MWTFAINLKNDWCINKNVNVVVWCGVIIVFNNSQGKVANKSLYNYQLHISTFETGMWTFEIHFKNDWCINKN